MQFTIGPVQIFAAIKRPEESIICPDCKGSGQDAKNIVDDFYSEFDEILHPDCRRCLGDGVIDPAADLVYAVRQTLNEYERKGFTSPTAWRNLNNALKRFEGE